MLAEIDASDIIDNIKADTDKLAEVAKASIVNLGVDEVCTALIDAWDEPHIIELCNRLHAHFTKPAQSAPPDLIPPVLRRPPAPPLKITPCVYEKIFTSVTPPSCTFLCPLTR